MSILPKACVCGHDHRTDHGEPISVCLECACIDEIPRCQNCGREAVGQVDGMDACSRACAEQLKHAIARAAA